MLERPCLDRKRLWKKVSRGDVGFLRLPAVLDCILQVCRVMGFKMWRLTDTGSQSRLSILRAQQFQLWCDSQSSF